MDRSVYRWEAKSRGAFIAQLVRYVISGHYFYITGMIPKKKVGKTAEIDRRILDRFGMERPYWKRQRRYLKKQAGIHYLRFERFWVIIVTKGDNDAFYDDFSRFCEEGERELNIRDIRRTALKFQGYSIRYTFSQADKCMKVFVRLDKPTYRLLKSECLEIGTRPRSADREECENELARLFGYRHAYGPVQEQFAAIVAAVNRKRRRAGYREVSEDCIPAMLKVTKVFSKECSTGVAEAA